MASRNPSTWDQYEGRGASPGRTGSMSSVRSGNRSVQFDGSEEEALLLGLSPSQEQDDDGGGAEWPQRLRRRRSSMTNRLAAFTDIGGVNSIRSFTRSWQRAAGFPEVIPQRPSFVFAPDQAPTTAQPDVEQYGRSDVDSALGTAVRPSLLRQHFGSSSSGLTPADFRDESPTPGGSRSPKRQLSASDYREYREREQKALLESERAALGFQVGSFTGTTRSGTESIFAIPPHLATPPLVGSYRSWSSSFLPPEGYGTIRGPEIPRDNIEEAAALWRQQQEAAAAGEIQQVLVKEVEQEDGKIVLAVEGQSTLPQTIFNSINVLIGIGLLSLPMGFKYAGWLCGITALTLSAAVTAYTARLLAKCMDLDPSIITFSDLAYVSFGRNARIATSILFTMELMAACVALVVLFADSLDLLFPGVLSVTGWKVICFLILIPLNFLPLRLLSFTSVIGIFSCFSIVLILLMDGFIKPTSPGSLIEPAKTYLFPKNWLTLPLSFGLLMSPWGGHSVFPNIYRDMRHPYKYAKAVKVTFSFTFILDMTTAVVGLLMFGDGVRDEITANILQATGYPRALTFLMCMFISIIPLTKIPLNARPIVSTLEVLLGVHKQAVAETYSGLVGRSAYFRGMMKVLLRVTTLFCFLVIAIVFPAFDSIMAFMGSALCFTICVTLPLAFYLKLFGKEIPPREKLAAWSIMTLSTILSVVGTVWAFLPKSLIGAE
ncbi:transmembrane amino acid transporter protein-domain-containing protein [Diplogelasinospora grovesii]|uniref:Transmembrane amino acid transporter protein-domain-containing protein n=1 Tax=Diplogelasinospora grovesii TaxID=303347 RepID=A0AAN6NF66_9PEZI|nr:transmembrane amino acid transporter protein-domain-containing protein [Diplogelasinospora grovesii]